MNVLCTICGGAGHLSKDCKQKRPGQPVANAPAQDKAKIDQEASYLIGIFWFSRGTRGLDRSVQNISEPKRFFSDR